MVSGVAWASPDQLVPGLLAAIIMTAAPCIIILSTISLNSVLGVITNQGPRGDGWIGGDEFEENEVREFTGWIQGRPEDYIMNLQRHQAQQHRSKAQSNTRKTAVGPKLNLFSPGIQNDYEYLIKKQNEVANFTYKKGKTFSKYKPRVLNEVNKTTAAATVMLVVTTTCRWMETCCSINTTGTGTGCICYQVVPRQKISNKVSP